MGIAGSNDTKMVSMINNSGDLLMMSTSLTTIASANKTTKPNSRTKISPN
jgi:hypothetical protein